MNTWPSLSPILFAGLLWLPLESTSADNLSSLSRSNGTDKGILIAAEQHPISKIGTSNLANGNKLIHYWYRGSLFSSRPNSPFYKANFFSVGATLLDSDGLAIYDAAIGESIDADGDVSWISIIEFHEDGYPSHFHFIGGTGKWRGIEGEGILTDYLGQREDGMHQTAWELKWETTNDLNESKRQ